MVRPISDLALPDDIVMEILSKLPGDTLCKFNFFPRRWCNIITHLIVRPHNLWLLNFQCKFRRPNTLDQRYFRRHNTWDESYPSEFCLSSFRFEDFFQENTQVEPTTKFSLCFHDLITVLPSNGGGLLCFYGEIKFGDKQFHLYNPKTSGMVRLPHPSSTKTSKGVSSAQVDFWYEPSTDEYKLMHLFYQSPSGSNCDLGCEILSVSNGRAHFCSWRILKQKCPFPTDRRGVKVGSSLYWSVDAFEDEAKKKLLLSFHVEKENFTTLDLPQIHESMCLLAFNGFLCVVGEFSEGDTMGLWILKNEAWVKQYVVRVPGFDPRYSLPLPIYPSEGQILTWFGRKSEGKEFVLHCYDIKNNTLKILDKVTCSPSSIWMCLYTPTSFSLR